MFLVNSEDILRYIRRLRENRQQRQKIVVANVDSDNSNLKDSIIIVPSQLGDKEKEMQAIEDVLDAYEPSIGEHSEVTFAELYDEEQYTETKEYGYRFFINMSDTHFKKAKRLWRFFDALFRTIQY